MGTKECLFCGRAISGKRAKEHAVADWLCEYLGIEHEIISPSVATTENEKIVDQRRHTVDGMLEGRVCEDCNNGWMSDLEDKVKPLLIPLLNAQQSVHGLPSAERLILARWAAKTAYMVNSSSNLDVAVNPSHIRFLAEDQTTLPEAVGVFIQHYEDSREFSWVQENHWPCFSLVPPEDGGKDKGRGGYKIGLQFRRLFLSVAHWPHSNWSFLLGAGMHMPVWPLQGNWPAYQVNEELILHDSYRTLRAFNRLLAIFEIPQKARG
jgi:hypothetical protein